MDFLDVHKNIDDLSYQTWGLRMREEATCKHLSTNTEIAPSWTDLSSCYLISVLLIISSA